MAEETSPIIQQWQEEAHVAIVETARGLLLRLKAVVEVVTLREEVSDVGFTFCIARIVDDARSVENLARRTNLDAKAIEQWIGGLNLPKSDQRKQIVALCLQDAFVEIESIDALRQFFHLALPELLDEPVSPAAQYATPSMDTLLSTMPGWSEITPRVREGLTRFSVLTFGDLLATPAYLLYRYTGRNGRNELIAWVTTFGAHIAKSEEHIENEPKFWRAFKAELPGAAFQPREWPCNHLTKEIGDKLKKLDLRTYGRLALVPKAELKKILRDDEFDLVRQALEAKGLTIGMERPSWDM